MQLGQRLHKLEERNTRAGRGRRCPGCGEVPGAPSTRGVCIIPAPMIHHIDEIRVPTPEELRKDFCAVCGRQIAFRIPSPTIARLASHSNTTPLTVASPRGTHGPTPRQ